MHTTVFKFGENSPYINGKRPVAQEINDRLLWQAIRLSKTGKRIVKDGLIIYTTIPAYLHGPSTFKVYWDYKSPDEMDMN